MALTTWLRSFNQRTGSGRRGRHALPSSRRRSPIQLTLEVLEDRTVPSWMVTNTNDAGAGSLRQAILDANTQAGADTIQFAIGTGVQTIHVGSTTGLALPNITDTVTIDGTSQPGYSGTPLIELDGTSAGANATGLTITAASCTVKGLIINSFSRFGIDLQSSSTVIQGSYIGVDTPGNTLRANTGGGVEVEASGNTIGGTAAGAGNVIGDGITLGHGDATLIQGNTIGLGADGSTVLGNHAYGIYVFESQNVVIGGATTTARNIISGNLGFGIITDGVANGLVIQGNYIGTDRTGESARGNTFCGIGIQSRDVLIGGPTATPGTGTGNVITGNGSGPHGGAGIAFSASDGSGCVVEGNIIGLDATGTTKLNNFQDGGVSCNASHVTIGGTTAGARNIISGNAAGVSLAFGSGSVVEGNYIGTDITGTHAVGNTSYGVVVSSGSSGNTIGGLTATPGTGAGNVISGNEDYGIWIDGGCNGNFVEGNLVGTDKTGNTLLANPSHGIFVAAAGNTIGGTAAGAGNVIGDGIGLYYADGSLIQGNTIGLGADGSTMLGNNAVGISVTQSRNIVIGGATPAARNVISGNTSFGIYTDNVADGLVIQGNYIGTDRTGTLPRGNTYYGIATYSKNVLIGGLTATPGTGAGNVISGNGPGPHGGGGIAFSNSDGSGCVVVGNIIGLDATGTTTLNNFQEGGVACNALNVTIGGTATGARNVISGNSAGVVLSFGSGSVVAGNFIGTDITGTHAVGGSAYGVVLAHGATGNTIGGTTAAARNVISGNTADGVEILGAGTNNNFVEGNYIGVGSDGTTNLANGIGVLVYGGAAANNTISDAIAGAGNVIAYNSGAGVSVTDASNTGNAIRGNSIHDNGGLGIDLGGDGVTPNNSAGHVGPNNYQNFPVITGAIPGGSSTQVNGTLDSTPNRTFTLDFYANTLPDPSGYGEGQTYLGSMTVTTDGSGHASFLAAVAPAPAALQYFSATATDSTGNTSEFGHTVLSVQQQITLICNQVDALVAAGYLNRGNGNALCVKLNAAIASLNRGDTTAAVNQLNAFINQVTVFQKTGKLTSAQAQPLIDAANQAIMAASGGSGAHLMNQDAPGASGSTDTQPVSAAGQLVTGAIGVYLDNADGTPVTADEQARFDDAIATLDATFGAYGVNLVDVGASDAADAVVRVEIAGTSAAGSAADGVLGCTVAGSITLLTGWNWYTGSDPTAIGSGRYDFETIVMHELAHAVGLGHSGDANSVMYAYLAPGQSHRVVTAADLSVLDSSDTAPAALRAAPWQAVAQPNAAPKERFSAGNEEPGIEGRNEIEALASRDLFFAFAEQQGGALPSGSQQLSSSSGEPSRFIRAASVDAVFAGKQPSSEDRSTAMPHFPHPHASSAADWLSGTITPHWARWNS